MEPSPFPYIHLRILFSNTLCLHSSLNVRNHVSQPYSTTGNIIYCFIYFNFIFSPIMPVLIRIKPIPRIETYFFKIHSNIVLPSSARSPQISFSCWFTSVTGQLDVVNSRFADSGPQWAVMLGIIKI